MAEVRKRRRSAFLEEFYQEAERAKPEPKPEDERAHTYLRRRRKGMPIWLLAPMLGIVFCLIAVGGSSVMIWLRYLSNIFDVHWAGD